MKTRSFGLTAMVMICLAALLAMLGGLVVTASIKPLLNPDGSVNTSAVIRHINPNEP